MALLLLVAMTSVPFAQATHSAYANEDAEALRSLFDRADSRVDSLLVRYRLYPLTEDETVLEGLPSSLPNGTPRELALLSGLWAYRAGEGSLFNALRYGRRSTHLLEEAKRQDEDAPFVLLVEGQSLLFRPAIAGRDAEAASQRFGRLRARVDEEGTSGICREEAQVWRWLALREAGHTQKAQRLRTRLLDAHLRPLYHQFLKDPPDV